MRLPRVFFPNISKRARRDQRRTLLTLSTSYLAFAAAVIDLLAAGTHMHRIQWHPLFDVFSRLNKRGEAGQSCRGQGSCDAGGVQRLPTRATLTTLRATKMGDQRMDDVARGVKAEEDYRGPVRVRRHHSTGLFLKNRHAWRPEDYHWDDERMLAVPTIPQPAADRQGPRDAPWGAPDDAHKQASVYAEPSSRGGSHLATVPPLRAVATKPLHGQSVPANVVEGNGDKRVHANVCRVPACENGCDDGYAASSGVCAMHMTVRLRRVFLFFNLI